MSDRPMANLRGVLSACPPTGLELRGSCSSGKQRVPMAGLFCRSSDFPVSFWISLPAFVADAYAGRVWPGQLFAVLSFRLTP